MEYITTDSKNKIPIDQSESYNTLVSTIGELAIEVQSLVSSLETLQTDLSNFITTVTTLGQTTYKIYGAYSG